MSTAAPALRTMAVTARKEARLEQRRSRLLHAALDLFAQRGYEETSVGAIVARARMSKFAFYERSTVARLLIVESVGLSASVDDVRHELQGQFASAVAEEVRHAMSHDAFYADKDPVFFGRAVVGAVNEAVSYFLTHPGADADSLAASLCRIFAP